jgi:hypothetical protein
MRVVLQTLSERTIEFGANPNQRGILAAMIGTDKGTDLALRTLVLADSPILTRCL